MPQMGHSCVGLFLGRLALLLFNCRSRPSTGSTQVSDLTEVCGLHLGSNGDERRGNPRPRGKVIDINEGGGWLAPATGGGEHGNSNGLPIKGAAGGGEHAPVEVGG